ncbi:LolA family protein [Erythrobacter rubeus]|uniref:Outer membrane lipoprotein carrier protein LolA n=1 Tax=Erythrobacter rubeus TaxID=2760803 RepID=A0ABR8KQK6_9SPHN|nr:outer membrane lipoprotein carrier protein LolA [Erythrobacter rubeus]MBD2843009.1 outer membrane lipoprotein carrier protein LolA [Erythrobacter rubeus]
MTMLKNFISSRLARVTIAGVAGALALTLPVAAPFGAVPAANAQTNAADLDRAVAALRAISTMRADFSQTDRAGNVAYGTMTLKRPGKIRFDYGKDADLLVVSNGRSLYMVDYEVNQVERWPIRKSPLGALLDPNRDMKKYGKLNPTGNPDVLSIEVRDPDRPEFGVINLIFVRNSRAPGGLELTHWVALDAQNYRTTVRLSNHRYGISVAESAFEFRDPRRSSRRPR